MAHADLKLEHYGTSQATTYHFRVSHGRSFGWTLCTVNDTTGELQIMSDWGDWSHRWGANPSSLGAPTLTHFLGDRDKYHCDYLARKLTSGDGKPAREEFDCDATLVAIRKEIVQARWEQAHCARVRLSAERARELYDDVARMRHVDEREIAEWWHDEEGSEYIISRDDEGLYGYMVRTETGSYRILREVILPALVATCAEVVALRARRDAGAGMAAS